MRIHYLLHIPEEQPAGAYLWGEKRGYCQSSTKFYQEDTLPSLDTFDLLIIMGGSMGIYQEVEFPWLKQEKLFIRQAIDKGKLVLGICLGAQLIADTLGAKVIKSSHSEIGWFPLTITKDGIENSYFNNLSKLSKVLHWHGDMFELPDVAQLLASSAGCQNQAFSYKENVLALQFHLEMTSQSLEDIIKLDEKSLIKDTYIQTKGEILANQNLLSTCNRAFFGMLDDFVGNIID